MCRAYLGKGWYGRGRRPGRCTRGCCRDGASAQPGERKCHGGNTEPEHDNLLLR
jgi:hypothetical protein